MLTFHFLLLSQNSTQVSSARFEQNNNEKEFEITIINRASTTSHFLSILGVFGRTGGRLTDWLTDWLTDHGEIECRLFDIYIYCAAWIAWDRANLALSTFDLRLEVSSFGKNRPTPRWPTTRLAGHLKPTTPGSARLSSSPFVLELNIQTASSLPSREIIVFMGWHLETALVDWRLSSWQRAMTTISRQSRDKMAAKETHAPSIQPSIQLTWTRLEVSQSVSHIGLTLVQNYSKHLSTKLKPEQKYSLSFARFVRFVYDHNSTLVRN